jgi:hypothetical protein
VKIRGKKNPYTPEAKNLEEYGIFFYLYLSSAGVIQIRFKGSPYASGLSGHASPRDFKYISISGKCQETWKLPLCRGMIYISRQKYDICDTVITCPPVVAKRRPRFFGGLSVLSSYGSILRSTAKDESGEYHS